MQDKPLGTVHYRYVGGGDGSGGHQYFRHILIGHEIFFKVFDAPQIIFLCSIFVILFFKFRGLKHKISEPAIKKI